MLTIQSLHSHQAEAVKRLIRQVCCELFQVSEQVVMGHDAMTDIDQAKTYYFGDRGLFLLLLDDETIVGCGAVRRLTDEQCELKRMWLLKDYRGRGLGTKLADRLLEFARQADYKTICLDMTDAQIQAQALRFYRRLGFYFIERYNGSPCTVFMEKVL